MGRVEGLKGSMFIEVFSTMTFISCSYPKTLLKMTTKDEIVVLTLNEQVNYT